MNLLATSNFIPADLSSLLRSVGTGAQQGVQAVAERLVETEQAYCPVDTGALRDSIASTVEEDEDTRFSMSLGPQMDYSAYVEYGTGQRGAASPDAGPYAYSASWPGMTPQPYCRPALDEMSAQYEDIVAQPIADAL